MIEPEAEIAAAITDSGRVGVLATPATVAGGAYLRALGRQHRELTVTQVAAPDLAAIIQRGFPFSEEVVETVRSYCAPLRRARVDTVILGCTHYPLVRPMLQRFLGRDVRLVSAGHALAATAQRILEARRLETARRGEGTYSLRLHGRPRGLPRARDPLPAAAARRGRARRGVGRRWLPCERGHPRTGSGRYPHGDEGGRARARRRAAHARRRPAEGPQGTAATTRSRSCAASASAASRRPPRTATAAATSAPRRRRARPARSSATCRPRSPTTSWTRRSTPRSPRPARRRRATWAR